jgi:hypothetical protein
VGSRAPRVIHVISRGEKTKPGKKNKNRGTFFLISHLECGTFALKRANVSVDKCGQQRRKSSLGLPFFM